MTQPWSEQLRLALQTLRQTIAVRATREQDVASGMKERTLATEQEFEEAKNSTQETFVVAEAGALAEAEHARQRLDAHYEAEKLKVETDHATAKQAIVKEYGAGKEALEADFEETRWTLNTVYEADKKVAKDQLQTAQDSCKKTVEHLEAQRQASIQLWQRLDFIDELPDPGPVEPPGKNDDPWPALEECRRQSDSALALLQSLHTTWHLNGVRPWLIVAALWLVLSLPAALQFDYWYYWLLGTTLLILPGGWLHFRAARQRVRTQVVSAWESLCRAAERGQLLFPIGMERAWLTYNHQKIESRHRFKAALQQAVESTRTHLDELRKVREERLQTAKAGAKSALAAIRRTRSLERKEAEATFIRHQAEAQAQHEGDLQQAGQVFQQAREENNRRHAQEWTDMLRHWKQGCDQLGQTCRFVNKECARSFPPWDDAWRPRTTLPLGLRFGALRLRLEDMEEGIPRDRHLPTPDLTGLSFPALLAFPEKASLLLRAHDAGKAEAIRALQALLLHAWAALPAGKTRSTIIDPVGRGENFAAFMHLADHEESLVHSRIWTESAHIEHRLTDLTVHMENVLQKYLRNQFQTLAEYNEQAGEVAEPFRFLVVADFPVNFSADACRRLISLASAGARCGIYAFVMIDTKQPLPQGIDRADLERSCTCLDWHDDHFIWEDADFGSLPLTLDAPPSPDVCTQWLDRIGAEAKRAGRVEVPFEWLAPARETWWTGDSRHGITVPLGRSGARSKQLLELGKGTSQHVLIAGKTGSGKSTLLHVLISQLAMHYSPREIELYLVDFKKGVEFKSYANHALPHARVVAVESEREFGLSVLQRLDGELGRRGELFRANGVNDLASYRAVAEKPDAPTSLPTLPRVLLIVDEFQEFFVEDDRVAQEAALLLDRLVRQGRAFGVHILLGSQTLGGAYSLARSTLDQMAVRVALQCSEADAHLILNRDNTEARLLSRPGEAIYNAAHGMLEGNHLFQIVWLADARRDELLRELHALSRQREDFRTPIVFEGSSAIELRQNEEIPRRLALGASAGPSWQAWLGEAVAIKDPTAAVIRKQSGSNLLMIGQHEETALGLTAASLVSLGVQIGPRAALAPVNLVVASPLDASAEATFSALTDVLPIRLTPPRDLGNLLGQLTDELDRRLQGMVGDGPIFLFLHGLHRLRELRRPEDDFGFSSKRDEKPSGYRQFIQLLKEGPPLGIFTILWCDTYTNVQRVLDRQTLREFDMRVLMQMSVADSSSLIDSPVAAKLGPQRALFFTEDQGRIEKFRPYALPSPDWVRALVGQRNGPLPAASAHSPELLAGR